MHKRRIGVWQRWLPWHSNVGIKKCSCVVVTVAMCSYSEIPTCGISLDLGVMASFNITGYSIDAQSVDGWVQCDTAIKRYCRDAIDEKTMLHLCNLYKNLLIIGIIARQTVYRPIPVISILISPSTLLLLLSFIPPKQYSTLQQSNRLKNTIYRLGLQNRNVSTITCSINKMFPHARLDSIRTKIRRWNVVFGQNHSNLISVYSS